MNSQITDSILMVRPVAFYGNEQTAVNNHFQNFDTDYSFRAIQHQALKEFDALVKKLDSKGLNLVIVEDTIDPSSPDSIFPNNWISFHENGKVFTYPMFAENRRKERRNDILEQISKQFQIEEVVRLDHWEEKGHYLEGTGSLILDRSSEIAYVALSERAHWEVIEDFKQRTRFQMITFQSNQSVKGRRLPIYHTNVMMYMGENFAVVCLDSIDDRKDRVRLAHLLYETGKELVTISEDQVLQFAGNGLQIKNKQGERFIVMSASAKNSLNQIQKKALEKNGEIIDSRLDTIEYFGGGSARCMMAEIFLPRKDHV